MKIFKQETDISCGVACLRSIFNYYRREFPEKEILDKNEFYNENNKITNPIISLGVTALKFGFRVKYIGYNPIIANDFSGNLRKSLEIKSKKYIDIGKFYVDKTIEFLNLGGELKIDKLNVNKLKKLIDENKFILVGVKPAYINKRSFLGRMHKVIIDDYNEAGFHVLDPNGKKYYTDFDSFLMAFYSAIPEVLIIKK